MSDLYFYNDRYQIIKQLNKTDNRNTILTKFLNNAFSDI